MNHHLNQACLIVCFSWLLVACDKSSTEPTISVKEEKMTQSNTPSPARDMRTQIPFSDEQQKYLVMTMQSLIRVLSKQSTLEQEENVLGKGTNEVPKDGPVKIRFYKVKTPIEKIPIILHRLTQADFWYKAETGFEPPNYPIGTYKMDLPASVFEGMTLEKTYVKEYEGTKPEYANRIRSTTRRF
jgi:hypothetical protein